MNIIIDTKFVKAVAFSTAADVVAAGKAAGNTTKEASLVGALYSMDRVQVGAQKAAEAAEKASVKLSGFAAKLAQKIVDRQLAK